MITNIFTIKRLKLSKKVWVKTKELTRFFKIVVWITSSSEIGEAIVILESRIKKLILRSGWDFTFHYLKEVLRSLIRILAGQSALQNPNGVVVKRDPNGLPTIIPLSLRKIIMNNNEYSKNRLMIVCILTAISVFRVFPTKPKIKLSSILKPFHGVSKTIPKVMIKGALVELNIHNLVLTKPKPLIIESSGPNSVKSTWGASIDALAFLKPDAFFSLIRYNGLNWITIWCSSIMVIALPFYLILRFISAESWKVINLGRLSVVYDQAGKARVIAILNWWSQCSLKPLHEAIFSVLRTLEGIDGTFDQDGCLDRFISRLAPGIKFYSFDLSAATDRIPIDLQIDILNILVPGLGTRWAKLLDFAWYYDGRYIKYSVGQPMGAYSSWAMLALSHHVIVQVAAHRSRISGFRDYIILGDDIVIANDDVASEYILIMKSLGVEINMSKTVESTLFCEFAKRWKGPTISFTPIGPGLILRLLRNKKYLNIFILSCVELDIFSTLRNMREIINESVIDKTASSMKVLWTSLSLSGALNKKLMDDKSFDESIITLFSYLDYYTPSLVYSIAYAFVNIRISEKGKAILQLAENKQYFYENWFKVYSSKNWPHRILEFLLKCLGPGFWLYAQSFERATVELENTRILLSSNDDISWSTVQKLVQDCEAFNIRNIDWTQNRAVNEQATKYLKLWYNISNTSPRTSGNMLLQEFEFM